MISQGDHHEYRSGRHGECMWGNNGNRTPVSHSPPSKLPVKRLEQVSHVASFGSKRAGKHTKVIVHDFTCCSFDFLWPAAIRSLARKAFINLAANDRLVGLDLQASPSFKFQSYYSASTCHNVPTHPVWATSANEPSPASLFPQNHL